MKRASKQASKQHLTNTMSAIRRIAGNRQRLIAALNVIRSDHHGHGPNMPPFARLRPPIGKLPEEVELVWDDSVSPETAIDFDAPHVSTAQAIASLLAAFGFIAGLYALVAWGNPEKSNPVAKRSAVIPPHSLAYDLGFKPITDEH